jgi:hypothetical protein
LSFCSWELPKLFPWIGKGRSQDLRPCEEFSAPQHSSGNHRVFGWSSALRIGSRFQLLSRESPMGFGEQRRLLPRVKQSFQETSLSSLSSLPAPLLNDRPCKSRGYTVEEKWEIQNG